MTSPASSLLSRVRNGPFFFHWVLVLLMAVIIPVLTAKTDKPGEFYPFSNFPMYSRFEPETYYVYVTDLQDHPVAVGPTFGIAISNVKKAYDRKLTNLKASVGGGKRKADLPPEIKEVAARDVLQWLADNAPKDKRAGIQALGGLKLQHVEIEYDQSAVHKTTTCAGTLQFNPNQPVP